MSRQMQGLLESGARRLLDSASDILIAEFRALNADESAQQDMLAALEADHFLGSLCRGEAEAIAELQRPLRSRTGHLVAGAFRDPPPNAILTQEEWLAACERLQYLAFHYVADPSPGARVLRNQCYYYLGQTQSNTVREFLLSMVRYERDDIGRRSLLIALALSGTPGLLGKELVNRIRDDERMRDLNLAYMSFWAGDRVTPDGNAFELSGRWTGRKTALWLSEDLGRRPALTELNIAALSALLAIKGDDVLPADPRTLGVLRHRLEEISTRGTDSRTRQELHRVLTAIDRRQPRTSAS